MSEVRKIQIQDGKGNVYHPQTVSEQVLDLDKRLEGLAKETYVDEKIAAIPEVDLSDIKNDISTLEENKANMNEVDKKIDDRIPFVDWEDVESHKLEALFSDNPPIEFTIKGKGVLLHTENWGTGTSLSIIRIDGKEVSWVTVDDDDIMFLPFNNELTVKGTYKRKGTVGVVKYILL